MPKVIEVIISPKGDATIQTKGFVGNECLQASKFLEEALGVPTRETKTPEFYQSEFVPQQVTQ
jgi:hypothetical protein